MCNTELKGLSGVIESPNFPNNYPHNRNCTWTIAAPLGNRINLTFSHFDVEQHGSQDSSALAPVNCMYDFVEVRQPNGTLGRFCGSSLPPELGSTQDKVMIQFMSDLSVAHNGFRLEWRVIGMLAGFIFHVRLIFIHSISFRMRWKVGETVWHFQITRVSSILSI